MDRKIAVIAAALDSDLRKAAAEARRAGFAGMQLPRALGKLLLPELSISGYREITTIFRAHQLELAGVRFDLDKTGLGPGSDTDAALDRIEAMLESARQLHANFVCVDIGPLPEPVAESTPAPKTGPLNAGLIIIPENSAPSTPPAPTQPFDAPFANHVDSALAELGNRADQYGVVIAFGNELCSFVALHRALRAARCPWFGVDLNPPAILRDRLDIDKIFSLLGSDIRHGRGRDAVVGTEKRARPTVVGMGSVNWDQLSSMLDDAGYQGWITMDPMELPDRRGAAIAGLQKLNGPSKT